jgi:hypothetical protein
MNKRLFVFLSLALLFGACAGGKGKVNFKKPESVALAFIKSIGTLDIAAAKNVATEDTKSVLGILETMTSVMPQEEKDKMIEESSAEISLIKKATCTTNDDIAKCTVCCNKDGESTPEPITLKKVDNKWLVDMSKEQLMQGKK